MKIIFLGGWGFSPANLSTLYGKHWQGEKILFFSWENWQYSKQQASVIPRPLFSHQLTALFANPLFAEPCIIVAWSLGAFCLHAYLETHWQRERKGSGEEKRKGQGKEKGSEVVGLEQTAIKKIILISCAKSFVQSRVNRYGVSIDTLNGMCNIIQQLILPADEQAQTNHNPQNTQSFRQMMQQFYQNTFSTTAHSKNNAKENDKENAKDNTKHNLISQKLLQTNQPLWQKSKTATWGRPLLTGLQQLATITLQRPLPYPVWLVQGKEDLILNQRGAAQMAQEFGYPYLCYPEIGHFVPAEKILEIIRL